MKQIFYFFTFCLVFLSSCRKEESTLYEAYIKNNTTHLINITPFSNGNVTANLISLPSLSEFQIANGSDRGLNGNVGFNSNYFQNADSIRVSFDNAYTITHYIQTPIILNNKHYLYSSIRNIANYLSYSFNSKQLSKNQRQNTYRFEFTEQDYLDAK